MPPFSLYARMNKKNKNRLPLAYLRGLRYNTKDAKS